MVVGPEEPLVNGIVDFLRKNKVKVFGPEKYAAKLEGSKAFMKMVCSQNEIPTAKFKICKKIKDINNFLKNCEFPLVVKADGLAAGKGVSICKSKMNNKIIILSAIDNLIKGGSGQAVQNFNIKFNFKETLGLIWLKEVS